MNELTLHKEHSTYSPNAYTLRLSDVPIGWVDINNLGDVVITQSTLPDRKPFVAYHKYERLGDCDVVILHVNLTT